MGRLVALTEIKVRPKGESYFRTYPIGTKFALRGYTDEKPRPLYARVILPDGKKYVVSLWEDTMIDIDKWKPRFTTLVV